MLELKRVEGFIFVDELVLENKLFEESRNIVRHKPALFRYPLHVYLLDKHRELITKLNKLKTPALEK